MIEYVDSYKIRAVRLDLSLDQNDPGTLNLMDTVTITAHGDPAEDGTRSYRSSDGLELVLEPDPHGTLPRVVEGSARWPGNEQRIASGRLSVYPA
jgi:hypothetical protein